MEFKSRVSKNKHLYEVVEESDASNIIESSLRDYERRIANENKEDEYIASRTKSRSEEEVVEAIVAPAELTKQDILKDRDLLAEFIEEVKLYNINRGFRTVSDTQANILETLNKPDEIDKFDNELFEGLDDDIFEVLEEANFEDFEAIKVEAENDLSVSLNPEEDKQLQEVFEEIETSALKVISDDMLDEKTFDVDDITALDLELEKAVDKVDYITISGDDKAEDKLSDSEIDFKSNELLELTQNLHLKLAESEEIVEYEEVTFLDRLLSFFISLLIIALLILIGVGIYFVAKERFNV